VQFVGRANSIFPIWHISGISSGRSTSTVSDIPSVCSVSAGGLLLQPDNKKQKAANSNMLMYRFI